MSLSHPRRVHLKMETTPPPAPRKQRSRCPFDDPEYIVVKYVETKVYINGHVEHATSERIFARREDVVTDEDILYTATCRSYLGAHTLRALDTRGYAVSVDERVRNNLRFHQLVLIKLKD